MDNLEFILCRRDNAESPMTLALWRRGADPIPFWASETVRDTERLGGFERLPTVALHADHSIYVGMNTGEVYRFSEGGSVDTHARFPPIGKGADDELHDLSTGARCITGLVMHNGVMYDGSAAGVFATDKDWCTHPHVALALDSHAGRLAIVPTRIRLGPKGSFITSEMADRYTFPQGSLVDVFTGDVLIKDVTPFDGSGCRPGRYAIAGDKLYVHHGNYPAERITVRQLPEDKELACTMIYASSGFVAHNGAMFDFRMLPLRRPEEGYISALVPSTDDFSTPDPVGTEGLASVTFWTPEVITSAVSAGDDILLTVYDREAKRTRTLAYDGAKATSVSESDGYVEFMRARRQ